MGFLRQVAGMTAINMGVDSWQKEGAERVLQTTGTKTLSTQDVHFFYTRSHLSALQSCALIFSTNFQFISTFK